MTMQRYHVIDILIDRPHIKITASLPMYIRLVTGVMFFPVVPPPANGVPDGDPLGMAGLSLQNEQLNVITNMKIYKKSPVYYASSEVKSAGGEVFLDRGYSKHDFFECNDAVSPNSSLVFKYTNRKLVVSLNDIERFNISFSKLKSLVGRNVVYEGWLVVPLVVETLGDIIMILTNRLFRNIEIHKSRLNEAIYQFIDPVSDEPIFKKDAGNEDYDEAFVMKLILRYDVE